MTSTVAIVVIFYGTHDSIDPMLDSNLESFPIPIRNMREKIIKCILTNLRLNDNNKPYSVDTILELHSNHGHKPDKN